MKERCVNCGGYRGATDPEFACTCERHYAPWWGKGCGYLFGSSKEAVMWAHLPATQKGIYLLPGDRIWIGDSDEAPHPVIRELSRGELLTLGSE